MFGFKILKQSVKSRARIGVISTPHGDIETPAFVPVATRASVRLLDSATLDTLGSQLLICNTFHLHITPGEQVVKKSGGLHSFMQWRKPLMTDSGGFQVFSMGFGTDHGVGKILKDEPGERLEKSAQPKHIKITEEGVEFRSPLDGAKLFLGPEESIRIQEDLGADIIFAFDECPSPLASAEYMRESIARTHRWATRCIDARTRNDQALYGIVQGGGFNDMRIESARTLGAMDVEGFGIGGEFGYDKQALCDVVSLTTAELPQEKPRHLLGVGHPEDFNYIAMGGADTFDCIAPTHYASHGTAFTHAGRIDLNKAEYLNAHEPLDAACLCNVCATYSRAYLSHLMRAKELTGMMLLTTHNVHYLNTLARNVRDAIARGDL